ncbi:hypothetical protein [Acidovorax sp. Root217]|uniref:hypothetical protein n=1 Tax=Acidovorax sp. Root217 TaxID=1736492 RepID=UPI00070C9D55|nr:hypothetical protein [Acidovorax sp. Root217]KRC27966.1 hypothetical protein ASE31_14310 [Acidovorax sp. Root217]
MSTPVATRRAPPRRGRWLFLGTLLLFWTLLFTSGMDRFKRPEPTAVAYTVEARALVGVNGLRLEEAGDNASRLSVRVVLDDVPDVRITVQSRHGDGDGPETLPGKFPGLTATREGDTLVLHWTDVPAPAGAQPRRPGKPAVWMEQIVLPTQFRHLALARARIEAQAPVERLEVAGQAIAVRGTVTHLDLWSTQCRPCGTWVVPAVAEDPAQCAERTRRGTASMEVQAAGMRSLRVDALAGKLDLSETQGLQSAVLQLGDSVAVSVDRASVLEKARGSARDDALGLPDACGVPAAAPRPVPVSSAYTSQAEDTPARQMP